MRNGVNLNLDEEKIKLLDKHRGDLSRDDFINRMLDEYLKNEGRIDFSKYNISKSDSESGSEEFNLALFMDDFKLFAHNIYDRLDRLEGLLIDQSTFSGAKRKEEYELDAEENIEYPEEEQPEEADGECPADNGTYGKDADSFEECLDCDVYDKCDELSGVA